MEAEKIEELSIPFEAVFVEVHIHRRLDFLPDLRRLVGEMVIGILQRQRR
jgi:hypothetical protein